MQVWYHMCEVACCTEMQPTQQMQCAGADALKDALAKLGLKCGGTLRQRAERLILTKTTPMEKLDRKLFAKGVVPAVRQLQHVPFRVPTLRSSQHSLQLADLFITLLAADFAGIHGSA